MFRKESDSATAARVTIASFVANNTKYFLPVFRNKL